MSAPRQVTLARLLPGRPLGEALFLSEPAEPRAIADAPVTESLPTPVARLPRDGDTPEPEPDAAAPDRGAATRKPPAARRRPSLGPRRPRRAR